MPTPIRRAATPMTQGRCHIGFLPADVDPLVLLFMLLLPVDLGSAGR
jgi:hypothetical protein